jgi:hypothetical protein
MLSFSSFGVTGQADHFHPVQQRPGMFMELEVATNITSDRS